MLKYFRCNNCNKIFPVEDAPKVYTSYESYYGVGSLFPNSTPLSYYVCPHCDDDNLEDINVCECSSCSAITTEEDAVSFKQEDFCLTCAIEIFSEYLIELLEKYCIEEYDYCLETFNANKHLGIHKCLEALVKFDIAIIYDYAYFIEDNMKGDD